MHWIKWQVGLRQGEHMARMHSRRKGKSGSRRPSVKVAPEWIELSSQEIEELVVKLGKEGLQAAMIGKILRDQYGIPYIQNVTGKSITKILTEHEFKIEHPDDLINLIKKAVGIRKHLKIHKSDVNNKVKLINVESKIRRLVKYYRDTGKLPKDWRYEPEQAALLVK